MQELVQVEHKRTKESDFPHTDEEILASLDRAIEDVKKGRCRRVF